MNHYKVYDSVAFSIFTMQMGFPGGARVKNPPANAGDIRDMGSVPGLGRSPGGGHGNTRQYSCLENAMDRGTYQATDHGLQELDRTERQTTT